MTTDNRSALGSAGRRDRRPPTIELSATEIPDRWRRPITWLLPDFPWALVAAGAAGAVLSMLVVFVTGLWPGRDSGIGALEVRLLQAEQQLREFASRPPPDAKTVDDLAGRFARLETEVAAPRPPTLDPALAGRLGALEADLKMLSERMALVGRRADEMAVITGDARQRSDANAAALAEIAQRLGRLAPPAIARAEVETLVGRIAALERSAGALESELRRRGGSTDGDHSLRMAVAATLLRTALERGDPFLAELQAAQALAADPALLAPLEAFAASGAPSAPALARELMALAPALIQGPRSLPRDAGFLGRLQASAEKLVRVRPIDEIAGDDPAAVVARIEVRAAQVDLAGALKELAKLPAAQRAPAQDWVAKAQAREAALELSRRFAAEAVGALAKGPP
jgi:hypothetical protein